jgi:hypothetical protein
MKPGYNGYTNYETWATALWIDNDECLCEEPARIASEMTDDGTLTAQELPLFRDRLQSWAEDVFLADMPESGLVADLLNSAWREIDWWDLARHYASTLEA